MTPVIGAVSRNDFLTSLDKIVIEPEQICAIVMQLNIRNGAAYWPKVPGLSGAVM